MIIGWIGKLGVNVFCLNVISVFLLVVVFLGNNSIDGNFMFVVFFCYKK